MKKIIDYNKLEEVKFKILDTILKNNIKSLDVNYENAELFHNKSFVVNNLSLIINDHTKKKITEITDDFFNHINYDTYNTIDLIVEDVETELPEKTDQFEQANSAIKSFILDFVTMTDYFLFLKKILNKDNYDILTRLLDSRSMILLEADTNYLTKTNFKFYIKNKNIYNNELNVNLQLPSNLDGISINENYNHVNNNFIRYKFNNPQKIIDNLQILKNNETKNLYADSDI